MTVLSRSKNAAARSAQTHGATRRAAAARSRPPGVRAQSWRWPRPRLAVLRRVRLDPPRSRTLPSDEPHSPPPAAGLRDGPRYPPSGGCPMSGRCRARGCTAVRTGRAPHAAPRQPGLAPAPVRDAAAAPTGGPVPRTRSAPTSAARRLLVVDDPDLLDDVLRLAPTAGVEVDVAADAGGGAALLAAAPPRRRGADGVAALRAARPAAAAGVVLLGREPRRRGVWQRAVELGAEHVRLPAGRRAAGWPTGWPRPPRAPGRRRRRRGRRRPRRGRRHARWPAPWRSPPPAPGRGALLVDGDPLGGGIDLVFGGEADRGAALARPGGTRGRVPAAALAEALPRMAGPVGAVLGPRRRRAVPGRGHDAPCSPPVGGRTTSSSSTCRAASTTPAARGARRRPTRVLLVVPAEVRAAAAAAGSPPAVGLHSRRPARGRARAGAGRLTGAAAGAGARPAAGRATCAPSPAWTLDLERGEPPARRGRGPLADAVRPAARRAGAAGRLGAHERPATASTPDGLLDRVAPAGSPARRRPTPAPPSAVAAALREEGGRCTATRSCSRCSARCRPRSSAPGRSSRCCATRGHRRPRQRPGRGLGRPRQRARAHAPCGSPTTPPCAGWRSGWPPPPAGGWTTRSPGSTPGSPAGCACTRSCRPIAPGGTCLSLRVPAPPGVHAWPSSSRRCAAAPTAPPAATAWWPRAPRSSSPAARAPARRPC